MTFQTAITRLILCSLSVASFERANARTLPTFADIAEQAKLTVVNIRSTQSIPARKPRLDPYQFFLSERLSQNKDATSLGSGVIVSGDGYILTNYHVIAGATTVQIQFADGQGRAEASVVGSDAQTDIALLRAKLPRGVRVADLGNSDLLRVGDWVLAIGNPFGYSHTVTSGIISAKGRVIGTGPYDGFLQTDAPIHPGNSGGPLIDMRGRVIGINAAVDADAYGIGFATPINVAKNILADLKTRGAVVRPWLGIVGKSMLNDDTVANAYDPVGAKGLVVANLVVESPAHRAGLKMGDVIIAANKQRVTDPMTLQKIVGKKKPNDSLELKIYRRGRGQLIITVPLGVLPKPDDLPSEKDLI